MQASQLHYKQIRPIYNEFEPREGYSMCGLKGRGGIQFRNERGLVNLSRLVRLNAKFQLVTSLLPTFRPD